MRRASFTGLASIVIALFLHVVPAAAQIPPQAPPAEPSVPQLTPEQLTTFAKAYAAVSEIRDAVHAELAQTRNKTPEAQKQLQEKMREQIATVLKQHELSDDDYKRATYVISTDPTQRKIFDEILAALPKKSEASR